MKVLVVDDEQVIRNFSIGQLASIGIDDIYEAAHGVEALKRLDELMPDVIALDIKMPFMDGISCLKHIRKFSKYNSIKIIMMGTEQFQESEEFVKSLGAIGLLTKPISRLELLKQFKEARLV